MSMKRLAWPLALIIVPIILGGAGLLVAYGAAPSPAAPPDAVATLRQTVTPSPATTGTASGRPSATPRRTPRPRPHRAGPWAVVASYYRDVGSRQYAQAWALISPALAPRQTYQQFVTGYACTGTEQPTRLAQSGHQVSFKLAVVNDCTGATQHYIGTDTVRGAKIVAADVAPVG